jgi:hypothetical protein
MLSPLTISYSSSPSSSQSASLISTKIPGRLQPISGEFSLVAARGRKNNLHRAVKHKKFLSLVLHSVIAKMSYKITNIDWSVVFVSRGYLDFVFAVVAEEHLKASPEEVSLWHLL